eukprot:6780469-Alexandrium_andersonii.AAC.1
MRTRGAKRRVLAEVRCKFAPPRAPCGFLRAWGAAVPPASASRARWGRQWGSPASVAACGRKRCAHG